jgi:CheY-like chemotaxis protein
MTTATKILIVDDSEVDLRLIGGLLRCNPQYRMELVENGKQALERIASAPPDLVITDLIMPEMNGLELLRLLQERHPDIPVILMTAYGNETIAVEALEAGAASYVPKARQAELLLETVERVVARVHADRNRSRLAECMGEIYCTYTLENNPALLPLLIDEVQQLLSRIGAGNVAERIRTSVALEEALLNAMYHGNLEISEDDLAAGRAGPGQDSLTRLIEQRRGLPHCRDRKVDLDVHVSKLGARFIIRDQGGGFDPQARTANRLDDYFEHGKNRGLMLMLSLMDEVGFNGVGNEVTLVRNSDLMRDQLRTAAEKRQPAGT